MISQKLIDTLTDTIFDVMKTNLPTTALDHVVATRDELQKNLHVLLQGVFSRLDLVTREEFDAQNAVLEATRKKLEEINAAMQVLEQQLSTSTKKSANK